MILSARIDFVKHRPGVGERKDGKQDKTTWSTTTPLDRYAAAAACQQRRVHPWTHRMV